MSAASARRGASASAMAAGAAPDAAPSAHAATRLIAAKGTATAAETIAVLRASHAPRRAPRANETAAAPLENPSRRTR